jgi:CRISPR/Cas system-associated exonuclease Cas4 (RecB family)
VKLFTHKPISLPELTTQEINNRRYYITPTGDYYPSITTLLGQCSKDSLENWKKDIGEENAKIISDYACDLGTNFHETIEKYINNDSAFLKNATVHSKYMFYGVQDYLDKIDNVLVQEAPLFSNVLKLAGRTDCIAEYDGELSIIDFKTSRKEKKEEWIPNYFVQGTAYSLMLEEETGIKVPNIVIIMCTYDSKPLIFKTKRSTHFKKLSEIIKQHLHDLLIQ